MEPNLDLFVHEGKVLELANPGTDEEVEREYQGPWPVLVWFTATDYGDGKGWKRGLFEKHARVVKDYLHDVGAGDETQAVLVEVPNAAALVRLDREQRFELCDRVPAEL